MTIRHALAAAITLWIGVHASETHAQSPEACRIVEARGAASVRRGGAALTAAAGLALARGDRIDTGDGARVAVHCTGGLRLSVGPGTRIVLDRLIGPPARSMGVRLLEGVAGFLLPRPRRGGFEVRTPSAVAAVRSTEWAVEVRARATAAFVHEGRVAVTAARGTVLLGPGEGVDVSAQGYARSAKRWGAARVAALSRRIGADW